jgi:hypothetical protein
MYAFSGCSSLKSIVIPKDTVSISSGVFDSAATTVYVYAESKQNLPLGWASNWAGVNVTVHYGYKGEDINTPDDND